MSDSDDLAGLTFADDRGEMIDRIAAVDAERPGEAAFFVVTPDGGQSVTYAPPSGDAIVVPAALVAHLASLDPS